MQQLCESERCPAGSRPHIAFCIMPISTRRSPCSAGHYATHENIDCLKTDRTFRPAMNFSLRSSSCALVDARSSGNADICSLNVSMNSFTCAQYLVQSMPLQSKSSPRNWLP